MTAESRNEPSATRSRFAWQLAVAAIVVIVFAANQAGVEPVFAAEDPLTEGFRNPPEATKPWCYWYWISDNISREGITRDLEAMARVGIGEALIGNIFLEDIPAGKVKVLSEPWWELVEHAIREGGRVGVNVGMFNCPGWSQSGGPWIKPNQAMRYLVSSETRLRGPARFEGKLAPPAEPFQDVAVLAFPVPESDADRLAALRPQVACTPEVPDLARIVDGSPETAAVLPAGGQGQALVVEITLREPLTARSLSLTPGDTPWSARCELLAVDDVGAVRSIRRFSFDRSNMKVNVGPMPRGPVTIAFDPVASKRFRLVLSEVSGKAALAEFELAPGARLESFVEKQLGKMHPTPLPMWDTYLWPEQAEPDRPALCVAPGQVQTLTGKLSADGTLRWDVPPGEWVVLRAGMTTTGTENSPASPEGQGLEVDKMNRQAAKAHFEAFIGQVLHRLPPSERTAFKRVVADSYEMGSQNWTDGFAAAFRGRYGYDPLPWLPVLTGRIVASADQSNRFLWDLRRLVADRIALDYVGGLRDLCRPHGLQLWLENYGHWGFPAEFLQYGGQSDRVGGEFWVTGSLGSIECRAASSAANTYGFPVVSAEAFTGGPPMQTMPSDMKARGDWAFCEGINHFVLHVYIQQPWDDRKPGVNAWFGTEFNRHNTWFEDGRAWIDYLRRCCHLLQQGARVADAAYFIGEDAPKMTGARDPELPPGRDFDYINAEVILGKLEVRDGLLALPNGARYRVLVLPPQATMRPAVLGKIRDLVAAGATLLGPPPQRSPSLENYPQCDEEVRRLATELWGDRRGAASGERRFNKGRVIWGKGLEEVFSADRLPPDFESSPKLRYTHRASKGADLYFVANPEPQEVVAAAAFRVDGKAPEFWWPASGRIERPAVYHPSGGTVRVPIHLGPHGSAFVVFRDAPQKGPIVSVARDGEVLVDAAAEIPAALAPSASGAPADDFTIAVWAKPAAETALLKEANRGAAGLGAERNDALFPPHGNTFGGASHAGCGLAVGRNGVCVFEHGASYFAPLLVHPAEIDDWTHVAIVYRQGQPSLYLNGQRVHTGLKSDYTVHPGTASQAGGSPFRGELGPFNELPRALGDAQIAALVESMARPDKTLPAGAIELCYGAKGAIEATVWQPGEYVLTRVGGAADTLRVDALPDPLRLDGPWDVQFAPGWNAPEKATFEHLQDWTERPEEGIKHYSGKATYRKAFTMPEAWAGRPLSLDLGVAHDLAVVCVNGRRVSTLWIAPWRVDVTGVAVPGENTLQIEVVNAWNNRVVGDRDLPPDQKRTWLAAPTVPKNAPLRPAGLLGPVTLSAGKKIELARP